MTVLSSPVPRGLHRAAMPALSSVPIYRKDVRALMKPILWLVLLQGIYMVGVALLYWYNGWPEAYAVASETLIVTGWAFGQTLALIAAAQFWAEERSAGTDALLLRLPAARRRIYVEKAAAGLTVLAIFWLLTASVHVAATPLGGLWPSEQSELLRGGMLEAMWDTGLGFGLGAGEGGLVFGMGVGEILAAVCLSSYLVGLPLSLLARRPVFVVLSGYAIWTIGAFGVSPGRTSPRGTSWR